METFFGVRYPDACRVWVCGPDLMVPLPSRLDLSNHSPDGFNWGYMGSGPAQLALAVLAWTLRDDNVAIDLHQGFKRSVIGRLMGDSWILPAESVRKWAQLSTPRLSRDEVTNATIDDLIRELTSGRLPSRRTKGVGN